MLVNLVLTGLEWVIILIIAVVIIMWGPSKIPELARALGRAKGEFDKANIEYQTVAKQTRDSKEKVQPSSDDILIETAKKLGIKTEGKTVEQISQEIVEKGKK